MEIQKAISIAQDSNSNRSPCHYTYGTPFFKYGIMPQIWEDPKLKDLLGNGGDNDPLDVMEIGSEMINVGSSQPG
ncbi:hypothetical protein ACHAXS_002212 [Conticribra weissflogii]